MDRTDDQEELHSKLFQDYVEKRGSNHFSDTALPTRGVGIVSNAQVHWAK